jgi:hypothetical protein
MLQDLRHSIRTIARAKGTTAVLLFSLALGTGTNAAIYSVVDALLLRGPAGVEDPSRLVSIYTSEFSEATYGRSSYILAPPVVVVDELVAHRSSVSALDKCVSNVETCRTSASPPASFNASPMAPSIAAGSRAADDDARGVVRRDCARRVYFATFFIRFTTRRSTCWRFRWRSRIVQPASAEYA